MFSLEQIPNCTLSGVSNWVSWVCTTVSACSCATAENTNNHIAQRYSVKCSQFVNLWDSQLYSQSCPKLSNWEKLFSTRQCSALVYSFSSSTYEQAAAAIHTHTQLTLYVRAAQLITMTVYRNFVPKLILGQIEILCTK